jgi:hypothetical protein
VTNGQFVYSGSAPPESPAAIEGGVRRHAVHESGKFGLAPKSAPVPVKAQKRLLSDVFGLLTIPHHAHQKAKYPALMASDQLLKRTVLAVLPGPDQLGIGVLNDYPATPG